MAAAGISSSGLFSYGGALSDAQKLQSDFQQLGKDLQAGNLTAAQSDFAALNQDAATFSPGAGAQGSSPIDNEFQQMAQDLQAGNLSAAQKNYTAIQQDLQAGAPPSAVASSPSDFEAPGETASGGVQGASQSQSDGTQSQGTQRHGHHHGHLHAGGTDGGSGEGQLGQALQSGTLDAAQQAYNALSQAWPQDSQNNTQTGPNSLSASAGYASAGINTTA